MLDENTEQRGDVYYDKNNPTRRIIFGLSYRAGDMTNCLYNRDPLERKDYLLFGQGPFDWAKLPPLTVVKRHNGDIEIFDGGGRHYKALCELGPDVSLPIIQHEGLTASDEELYLWDSLNKDRKHVAKILILVGKWRMNQEPAKSMVDNLISLGKNVTAHDATSISSVPFIRDAWEAGHTQDVISVVDATYGALSKSASNATILIGVLGVYLWADKKNREVDEETLHQALSGGGDNATKFIKNADHVFSRMASNVTNQLIQNYNKLARGTDVRNLPKYPPPSEK